MMSEQSVIDELRMMLTMGGTPFEHAIRRLIAAVLELEDRTIAIENNVKALEAIVSHQTDNQSQMVEAINNNLTLIRRLIDDD